jgi:hypothetical protein
VRRKLLLLIAALVVAGAATGIVLLATAGGSEQHGLPSFPGEPTISVISPRDGSKHTSRAVVVKASIDKFQLSPKNFQGQPALRQGFIRFALNKVPEGVSESTIQAAEENPLGSGRVIGRSFDFPRYSGPNGILAERIGSAGAYSPALEPQIYYHNLPEGFYRLVITLAQNNGATTPFHTVTHFRIDTP